MIIGRAQVILLFGDVLIVCPHTEIAVFELQKVKFAKPRTQSPRLLLSVISMPRTSP
jgi:hypothetical protein